ncbi:hypothetical protein V2J09_016463 [Rumex salicifolius]
MAFSRFRSSLSASKINFTPLLSLFQIPSLSRRFISSNLPSELENVGFIGLGNMGSRMALNLMNSGFKISVHDVNSSTLATFKSKGASVKESPAAVAEASDVVITMLPSSNHVMDVYTGPNGLLNSGDLLNPWLFIDSSTIDPQTSRKLSLAVADRPLRQKKGQGENPVMLDAPVSGGILGAEAATLTFMVGGLEEAYLVAQPLFLSMGKASVYCGASGNGSAAKICNNLAMAVSMIGVSEAFALGQALGIELKTLTNIFNSSSARCWSSYNPVPGVMDGVPSSRNYQGGFSSKLMTKDLKLAAVCANETRIKYPLTSQAQEIYNIVCKDGHETEDFSSVFRYFYGGKDEV